jgi:hypothetical protein
LAVSFTIIILGLFEYIKRIILSNLSLDLIRTKWNILKGSVAWWFFMSLAIVGGSAYLSVVGAKNFSETSKKRNIAVETNIQSEIDSITNVFNERKNVIVLDNNKLRESNSELRDKIAETPLNYVQTRKGYQDIVDANMKAINDNDIRINKLDSTLQVKIDGLKTNQQIKIDENLKEDVGNIILFILISSAIEFVIIFGIWFREYYDYNVFLLSESKLETIHKRRKNYKVLLQFVYKNGTLGQDEPIIATTKLKEMVAEKAIVPSPNRLVDDFFRDCAYLGILKVVGKKRYTVLSYQDALKKIDDFDDTVRVLENLT